MATIKEIQTQLSSITNAKIKQTDIAKALNVGKANISLRIKNNSKMTFEEIKKIEDYFHVSIYNPSLNSQERYCNLSMVINKKDCGKRFLEIQTKNNLSNRQFAGFLDITEDNLCDIISGKILPDWNVIENLKQNFIVSLDWLMFGE